MILLALVLAATDGRIVLVGGGDVPDEAVARCLEGNRGRVLVVPVASGDPFGAAAGATELFQSAESVTIWNTDRAGELLADADVVWFTGGDQNRITGALRDTPAFEALHAFHRRGGVIGGTSAGAAMAGDRMITGEGDFERIAADAVEIAAGMELLPGAIVDQHFVVRNRFNRLVSAVLAHPDHVGIGIDEDTAVEFQGRTARVISDGTAVVIRSGGDGDLRVRVLQHGDQVEF